jgi:hypothetical protein
VPKTTGTSFTDIQKVDRISDWSNHRGFNSGLTIGRNGGKDHFKWWSFDRRVENSACLDNRINSYEWEIFFV